MTDRAIAIAVVAACSAPAKQEPRPVPRRAPVDQLAEDPRELYCGRENRGMGLCYDNPGTCEMWHRSEGGCTPTGHPRWLCKTGAHPDEPKLREACFPTRELCERTPVGGPDYVQSRCISTRPVWCTLHDFGITCWAKQATCDALVAEARKGSYSRGHEPTLCFSR